MGSSCLEVTMARICVLLFIALVSAISFSGVVAQDITEVELGDTDNSISQLTISEGIIRERRLADADAEKKKKKGGKKGRKATGRKVDKKNRRKIGNKKKGTGRKVDKKKGRKIGNKNKNKKIK